MGQNCAVRRGWVTLSTNFKKRGSSTNKFWRQKTRVPVLSWSCLRDPTFSRFDTIPACDTQTRDDGYYRTELAPRG